VDPSLASCKIEGRVFFQNGADVHNSLIRGPAIIGPGCVVRDSFVGPFTSIGSGSHLTGVEIENSIVMSDCRIEHVPTRIDSSLIGQEVVIGSSDSHHRSNQFVLADQSQICLPRP